MSDPADPREDLGRLADSPGKPPGEADAPVSGSVASPIGSSPPAGGADTEREPATPTAEPGDSAGHAEKVVSKSGLVGQASRTDREALPEPAPSPVAPDAASLHNWNEQVRRRMRRQSRRAFLGMALGAAAGYGVGDWLFSRRALDGQPWPLRLVLEMNEHLARDCFSTRRLAPTSAPDRVVADRVNGDLGLPAPLDAAAWKLKVEGAATGDTLTLNLDDIKRLPRTDVTTELNCIEGWSVLVHWAGVRFIDFMRAYPPATMSGDPFRVDHLEDLPPYVGLETPDGGYYVGLDSDSAGHPQTLLCYEMNGAPLTEEHGAPLRLVIPVKYGVKNLKRIGTIRYTTRRPADYWAEQGYDWYIGL